MWVPDKMLPGRAWAPRLGGEDEGRATGGKAKQRRQRALGESV